ncbi:MAG: c-type cytochrome, partial [Verrucomicrobiales bacterium]
HSDNSPIRDLFQRFLPADQRRKVLGTGFAAEEVLALEGDKESGRTLFHSPAGTQCFTCHRVEGKGRELGPDLSDLGKRYARAEVLNHIIKPNILVDPRWKLNVIVTNDDQTHSGFVSKSEDEKIFFRTVLAEDVVIPVSSIRSNDELPTSLMPAGMLDSLTAQEAADLLAYLSK